jgi:serine/threonine-protein kinase
MSLRTGDRIGNYEITAPIGKGGMGEVYRARDLRLKREVAIKTLPSSLSVDPPRIQRFLREAELLASLNHPNIAQIHGLEEAEGTRAIVMELVEGETFAEMIKRGPIPLDQTLNYAKQILSAFEYAHDRPSPVIHRDLKPANVIVTPEGVVKVLDFGLAKALTEDRMEGTDPQMSPTLTLGQTAAGVILGTAAYMSPEQAKGKPLDRRTDIWSFGVMLYEMATGRRLFQGEDQTEVLAGVIKEEPSLEAAPAPLRHVIARCIRKDKSKRWYSMEDIRFALDEPEQAILMSVTSPAAAKSTSAATRWIVASVLAAGLAVLAVPAWTHFREKPEERPLLRVDFDLGEDVFLPLPVGGASDIAISPDGTRIVYTSDPSAAVPTLYVRKLDQAKATVLAQGGDPVFSPDGQWIAFDNTSRQPSKISVDGGAVVPVTSLNRYGAGVGWGERAGFIMPGRGKGLLRIGTDGSDPEALTELSQGEAVHSYPKVLPGDKAVLFVTQTGRSGDDSKMIEVVTLANRRRKILVRGGTSPHYLPTGHLIYTNKSTLFAVPFDLDKLEVRGTPVPLVSDVASSITGVGQFDVSGTGTLIYRKSGELADQNTTIQWVDPSGKKQPLLAKPAPYAQLRFSPDGKKLALAIAGEEQAGLWVYDIQRDTMTRLTSGGRDRFPEWSPDGKYIAFSNSTGGVYFTRSDGAIQPQALVPEQATLNPSSFSPNGKRLSYTKASPTAQDWMVPLEEEGGQLKAGQPEPFLKSELLNAGGRFSQDGRWLAYFSTQSGTYEIYVRAFPAPASGQGGKWQISNNGARNQPWWAHNGHELYYQQLDQVMAVSYSVKGDAFVAEKPRVWIPKLTGSNIAAGAIDVAPDDKRVAVVAPVESTEAPKQEHVIVMLLNFFDEVRRRVPTGK